MKTIGLIGGLTWLSTVEYYKLLNHKTNEKLGGVASAKIILYSVEFQQIKDLTFANDWNGIAAIISDAAIKLEKAGANCILVCANTMHKIADQIQAAVHIPIIHIAEATANVVASKGLTKVALLGTRYTMQLDFYKNKLAAKNIEIIIPETEEEIEYINDAIYKEMGVGIFLPERKEGFKKIIQKLQQRGAQGVILGCTEIPILIQQEDVAVPIFDTTNIHADAALAFAFES